MRCASRLTGTVKDGKLLIIGIRTLRITDTRLNHDQPGVYDDLISLMRLA